MTKELFECATGYLSDCEDILIEGNKVGYFKRPKCVLNIHEIAHKYKEWALEQDYDLWSFYSKSLNSGYCYVFSSNEECDELYHAKKEFDADTEPEAIFLACQWILDNIESKGE